MAGGGGGIDSGRAAAVLTLTVNKGGGVDSDIQESEVLNAETAEYMRGDARVRESKFKQNGREIIFRYSVDTERDDSDTGNGVWVGTGNYATAEVLLYKNKAGQITDVSAVLRAIEDMYPGGRIYAPFVLTPKVKIDVGG